MIAFWVLYLGCLIVGFVLAKVSWSEYANDILLCGVRKIAYSCSQMGRPEGKEKEVMWWEPAFCVYWGVLVKFVNPMLLMFIMVAAFKKDIDEPYEGYGSAWRVVGFAIPLIGLILFVVATLFCQKAQELDYSEFELWTESADKPLKQVAPETALAEINADG